MRPPQMQRIPLSLPLSKSYGATPTSAAILVRLSWPSSGKSAIRVHASTAPTPGIEVMQPVAPGERCITHDDLDQALVDFSDVGSKTRDAAPRKTLQHRIFQHSGGILGGDLRVAELAANGNHLREPFGRRPLPLDWVRRHNGHQRRDHARVEAIVLGQNTARFSKLSPLERIDLAHRHSSGEQGPHDTTLVSTTRLETDRGD